jgi:hypothetical protein
MSAELDSEAQREQRESKPGAQMWAEAPDASHVVEFDNHRVGDTQSTDTGVANRGAGLRIADALSPLQAAECSAQQHAQVVAPAENHPAEQR